MQMVKLNTSLRPSLDMKQISIETTGWAAVALVIPMNKVAVYIDPMALNKSCWVSLSKKESVREYNGTDWHLDPKILQGKMEKKKKKIHRI